KIFLYAGHHEQLFILLWRLRQRIKFSGRDPARHQKIARTFWGAFGKDWRFHFHISLAVEIITRRLCDSMTQPQIACETWPPEIKISVRQSQIFILGLSINRERQSVGPIQN